MVAIAGARIRFPGNPWPKGHGLTKVEWSAVLAPDGLWFHLHLESEDYNKDDDREDEDEAATDWQSRGAWNNYHACTLSSTKWAAERTTGGSAPGGFLVARPGRPIDLDKLEGKTFRVDPIKGDSIPDDVDLEDLTFGIYLLGHDSVCDHGISFVRRRARRTYDVRWRARVALTYAGSYDLDHSLEATLPRARLDSISLCGLDGRTALEILPSVITRPRDWKLQRGKLVPAGAIR
jgi:hypothetical protein